MIDIILPVFNGYKHLEEQLDFYRLDPCSSKVRSPSLLHFICEESTAEFHPILGNICDLVQSNIKLLHIFTDGDGDIGLDQQDTFPPFDEGSLYYYNFHQFLV